MCCYLLKFSSFFLVIRIDLMFEKDYDSLRPPWVSSTNITIAFSLMDSYWKCSIGIILGNSKSLLLANLDSASTWAFLRHNFCMCLNISQCGRRPSLVYGVLRCSLPLW